MPSLLLHHLALATFALAPDAVAQSRTVVPDSVIDSDYRPVNLALVNIGRDLFYDKILSGNRNIACATCHHPTFATTDGLSLGIGEGAIGLGPDRTPDPANMPELRIGRNSPALFNLGAREFTRLFHDGRLEEDPSRPSGLRTPMEDEMVQGFDGVLAAQTMFPVLSQDEMAGHYSENDVSRAVRLGIITGEGGAWEILANRVDAIPAYSDRFALAIPETAADRPLAFTDISNALASFMSVEFRADQSPFDLYLRGQGTLPVEALAGLDLFYGKAGCAACHSGPFQTDHAFHAVAMPQLGPGKSARFERHQRDEGRLRVTGQIDDLYRFRTPSLRNVAQTGPWGHAGAYTSLRDTVRHMAAPAAALATYDRTQINSGNWDDPTPLWTTMDNDADYGAILSANEISGIDLSKIEIEQIVSFLEALTDQASLKGLLGIPETVPSGLPID